MYFQVRGSLAALLLSGMSLCAQTAQWLTTAQLVASAADAYQTDANAHTPHFREDNPLMRPFVTHGRPLLIGTFAVDAVIPIGLGYWLESHRHRKLALVVRCFGIASNAWGFGYSYHYRNAY